MGKITFKEKFSKYRLWLSAGLFIMATIFLLAGYMEAVDSFAEALVILFIMLLPLGFSYYFLLQKFLENRLITVFIIMSSIPMITGIIGGFLFNDEVGVTVLFYLLFGPLFFIIIASLANIKKHFVIIPFFLFGIIGSLFLKSMHWPGAGAMLVVSFSTLIVIFLQQIFTTIFRNKKNRFLQIMGAFCSLVLAIGYAGFLFKMMHWPFSYVMYQTALPLYLVSSFIMVIGIQFADFTNWIAQQRTFLTRNILIPWFFIFIISGVRVLFPDTWNYIMNVIPDQQHEAYWNMEDYELNENAD